MNLRRDDGGRLFFGAVPDSATAAQIHRLAKILKYAHGFGGQPIEPGRLHVTLLFLGGFSQPLLQMAREAASDGRTPPFEMSFDRTASFGGRPGSRPLVLVGNEELKRRVNSLGAALTRKGLKGFAHREFTPHLTLLYGEHEVDEYPVVPFGWTVNEFVLIHSLHGHAHLARWRLGV
jgi:RNA 2',3'-cyclic 3'-phosphodiesterase